MNETHFPEIPRILSDQEKAQLSQDIFSKIDTEIWQDAAYANLLGVKTLIKNGDNEYTKAEILGTLAYVFKKDRATLEAYTSFEI